jgi:hypothetical protein
MVALWMLFATTLSSSMAWLAGRHRLAAVLGAVCGPLSYAAGARLGAIELPPHALASFAGIALVWGLAMPALLVIREVLCQRSAGVPAPQPVRVVQQEQRICDARRNAKDVQRMKIVFTGATGFVGTELVRRDLEVIFDFGRQRIQELLG